MLNVNVYGEQDLSKNYPVGPAGTITMPLIGQVPVADLTLDQAQQVLTKRLKTVLRSPHLVVGIDEASSVRKVYVLGYVTTQGPLELHLGATIFDALAAAGPTDISDLRQIQLTHPGQTPVTLDLSGLRTGKLLGVNDRLIFGDVIYVPKLEDRVSVLGQVKTPGSAVMPLGQTITVLDALARIGGGLTADASLSNALLVHVSGDATPINLDALMKRGDISQNVVLQAGDTLVVQQAENISVVGEVVQPVSFLSNQPVTVLQALAQAGGFTAKADLAHTQLVSARGVTRVLDIKALWDRGDLSQNVKLQPGDVLVLPKMAATNLLIVGAVVKPGVIDLADTQQRDLLRMVTYAGVSPQSDLTKVQVYRDEQQFVIDVNAVMNGDVKSNMQLQPDDIVMVPEKSVIYVLGTVLHQGKLPWDTKLTVLDAISDAGGLGPRANENGTILVRPVAKGKTQIFKVPLGDLRKGKAPENYRLQPGDIIFVPNLGEREAGMGILRDLMYMATTVISLTR
jgi:polysaccharide export outer membrane protein